MRLAVPHLGRPPSVALAWYVDPRWMWLAGLTAVIMISSAFTGFCPVHWAISKLVKD